MAAEPVLETTEISEISNIVERVRNGFRSYKTLEIPYRIQQLQNLKRMVKENEQAIKDALYHDLHKNECEATMMEVNIVNKDIIKAIENITEWTSPQHQPKNLLNKFNSVYIQPEPYGVVLLIAPWNYPFQLSMLPLVGAIAAGNCCIVKPSESSVAMSNLLLNLLSKYLDPECYAIIAGEVDCARALLEEKYDYIFFTGSTNVGKVVMKHASENLTPVTLELGGKSPVLVAPDANIEVAARRIMWGKCLNSGQTCIAPDYVLCPRNKKEQLIEACKKTVIEFFGENPKECKDYGRLINVRHFKRLVKLLDETNGRKVFGGDTDEDSCYFPPTLVDEVTPDDKLMQEELFGPILPFVTIEDVEDGINFVNAREKPLAFYVFTESSAVFNEVNKKTSAGGMCHNDTIMQGGTGVLPFGGVGHSGIGCYHGKFSFDTFSHYKPVLETGTKLEFLNKIRYPPFTKAKAARLGMLLAPRERSNFPWKLFTLFILVAMVAAAVQMYGLPGWLYRFMNK